VITSPSFRTANRRKLAGSMLVRMARVLPSPNANWHTPVC